ncbi:MAG: efflux RND transporter permease subunit [Gammaproteobacteria bacterium]|nr:efflux RND transporter permease subunit [Gammaproteobacteria bacterium]
MIRYFVTHPTAANLLMLIIMVLGLTALPKLQRDTFPVIPATEVEVRLSYPGATALDVEQGICHVTEEALDTVTDIVEVRCDARENLAIITAKMLETADLGTFYDDVKSAVESITTFPDKVEPPSTILLERTANIASIAITAEPGIEMSTESLNQYAERVKNRIARDRRIAQVRLKGFSDREILIQIKEAQLQKYALTVNDVNQAIRSQSIDSPAGSLENRDGSILVRYNEQRKTLTEFSKLIVFSGSEGGTVSLGDIASISYNYEKQEEKILFNGQRAALLDMIKTTQQDSLRVMDAVLQNLERERKMAPRGIRLQISQDVTRNIKDRLRILVENGVVGLILVFLTMWAFFSFRYSFWVTMGLPVSFLGAIFAMNLFGYSINMITMVALLVAIGLLMDDAIIISENIATQIKKGKNASQAAIEGVQQVLPGVLSSFLTTIMIVGPLFYMTGKMGAVLKYMPAVLVITLAVSLIEAFLILPAHLNHSIAHMHRTERSRFHLWFEQKFINVRDNWFAPLVSLSVKRPYISLGVMLFILLTSFATIPAGMLKFRAFPQLESDVIQARILLPQGTSLNRTEEVVAKVEAGLKALNTDYAPRQKGGIDLVRNVTALYNNNVDSKESGTHIATISADLIRAENRNGSIEQMLLDWRELTGDVGDVINLSFTDKERGVAGKAIDIRLQGSNLDMLKKASLDLQNYLSDFKGVIEVYDDIRPGKPEISINLKKQAGVLGINSTQVSAEVRAALQGTTGLEVQVSKETQAVTVRLADEDRKGLNDLQFLQIRNKSGHLVPLSSVADLTMTRGLSRVHRVNGQRTATIQGKLNTRQLNASELMQRVKLEYMPKLKEKFPGVKPAFQGQGKETADTSNSLLMNLTIGVFGVFVILSFQFRSYIQPLAVMLAIPMGSIGVFWGHIALGLELSIPSLVGMATLAGIVVNDNILLVTFIKERLKEGAAIGEAVQLAAHDRFRAIVLTSLTTIAGLLPLLMETSTQAQLLIPIVASLVFGLASATLFSILLVPAFFKILDDWTDLKA